MVALRFRLLILVAALIAFGGALWAPFQFDDFSLLADPALDSPGGWREAFRLVEARPLVFLSYWLNLRVSRDPLGFHLVSLALHLLCVWTACVVFERLLPVRAARLAAAIYAVHPLLTEAVVYVSARSTLLATLFCLLTLQFWRNGTRWASVAFFALAVLSKEEALALPLFLVLLEWSAGSVKHSLGPLASMFALSAAAGLRSAYATLATAGGGAGAQAAILSFDYFSFQGVAILRYLWLLLVPVGMTVDPEVRVAPLPASLAWGVIAVIGILAWRTARRLQAGFWLLGGLALLLPSASAFPAADLAADSRMYLPMLAFAGLFGFLLRGASLRLLGAWLALLTVLAWSHVRTWQSPEALWMEAARQAPEKVRPKRQLARLVTAQQAVALLEQARRIAPDDAAVAGDLGLAYLRAGKPERALTEFDRALALAPASAEAVNNRGAAFLALGQTEAALADFNRALEKDPCLFDAFWNLAKAGVSRIPPPGCRWTAGQQSLLATPGGNRGPGRPPTSAP